MRLLLNAGTVKEYAAEPPTTADPDRVPLTELNEAFDLMLAGEVKRSVVVY